MLSRYVADFILASGLTCTFCSTVYGMENVFDPLLGSSHARLTQEIDRLRLTRFSSRRYLRSGHRS